MQVIASAKNVRMSPDKIRLVVAQIKKLPPAKAVRVLTVVNKKAADPLKKVIQSAIANSKNNHGLDETSLVFKEIQITKGMVFKRFRPIARGRVHHILKRTSHISIVLEGERPKKETSQSTSDEQKIIEPAKSTNQEIQKAEKGRKNGTKS